MSAVRLEASLPRARFFAGEPVALTIAIRNEGAQAVTAPVPFAPSRRGVRLAVRDSVSGVTAPLGPAEPAGGQTVRIDAGGFYFTETPLTGWRPFPPGVYQVAVLWKHEAGESLASPVQFEIVAADRARLRFGDETFAGLPTERRAVATVSGAGGGILFERTFRAAHDDESLWEPAGDAIRLVADEPLGTPLPVLPAERSPRWVVCQAGNGLLARAGAEMEGSARAVWPAETSADIAAPALETGAGELEVYSLRGGAPVRELYRTRFAPPVTAVEEPAGPDDWDDEVLVAGPVSEELVAPIDAAPGPVTLVRAGEDEIRLLTVSGHGGGAALRQITLRGGALAGVERLDLPGRPVWDAAPAVRWDGAATTAAVLLHRLAADGSTNQVGVAVARFDAGGANIAAEARFCDLPAAPRSGTVAWSFLAGEPSFHSWLVLCEDGSAHCGDSGGRHTRLPADLPLAEPVSFSVCGMFRQAAVPGDFGLILRRIEPPQ